MGDMETSSDLTLGALFGRYKGWRNSVETPVATAPPADGEAAPAEVTGPDGALIVQFEATAKEDLRVGFAPAHHVKPQWRYELALGFSGNTEVAVRKYAAGAAKEIELANVFAGRTLSGDKFVPYWIVVQQGVLTAGIGQQVGVDPLVRCADAKDPVGVHQVAFTTWNQPASVRNLKLEFVVDTLPVEQWTPRVIVRGDPYGDEDLLTAEQRALYERECELITRRVERFGGEFVAPDLKKFLDPKVIRRLQRTGATERGFTTGFDLASESETSKREARMKRFDTPQFGVEYSTETARALAEGVTQEEWAAREAEKQKLRERAIKFGLDPDANPKLSAAGGMNMKPATRKVREERCDVKTDTMVEFRDDAIHVYSLDDRFQQVRTNDVMEYFAGYGPWYVEWINDSSCTVVFEDAGTAGRALIALGDEVPPQTIKARKPRNNQDESSDATDSAPPVTATEANGNADEDVDMDGDLDPSATAEAPAPAASSEPTETPDESFNRSQWRYGKEVGSATQPASKKWRLLLRRATSDDFPPEKNKKYHERRSHPQQRGRGHRDANSQQPRQRQNSSRSHPYAKGGSGGDGRNRRGDVSDDQPRVERRGRGNRGSGDNSNASDGLGLLGDFQMPSRGSGRKVTEVASSSMDD